MVHVVSIQGSALEAKNVHLMTFQVIRWRSNIVHLEEKR